MLVTRTTNQLHFEDLDPIRFEELILSMVSRMKGWHKLDHFGKKGSDDGVDIRAVELLENGESNTYFFQCKRYREMKISTLKSIVDDYISKNNFIPQFYILVVSCSLTKKHIEYFESYCNEKGFNTVKVWTSSVIEAMLYNEYKDLLSVYFGINLLSGGNAEDDNDDYNEYIDNYQNRIFWGRNSNISLKNLYVWNSYSIGESSLKYDDLEKLINAFFNNTIDEFLNEKNIYQYDLVNALFCKGYPGCGKTSLVTKIASLYEREYIYNCKVYFINMARFSYDQLNLENIIKKLNINKIQLKNCFLIIDSLDEALKNIRNIQESLEDVLYDLYVLGCKSIITCRSNLIEENLLRNCLCITISSFDKNAVIKWFDNYYAVDSNFNIKEWKECINGISDQISKIIFIPLILYICVVQNIEISNIRSIGQLYDILFDESNGEIAMTRHREKANYKKDDWLSVRNFVSDISVKMYQRGMLSEDDIQNNSFGTEDLKRYFGLDFYIVQEKCKLKFVHASIWQYFMAERLYNIIKSFDEYRCQEKMMLELSGIFILNKKVDNMILIFLDYFMTRDSWEVNNIDDYINSLMKVSYYSFCQLGDKFEWIATFFGELFRIVTLILEKKFKYLLKSFFPTYITGEYHDCFVRYTRSSSISPVVSLKSYQIVGCNLEGTNFAYTDLSGCVIRKSLFRSAWFNNALLSGAYADQCDFTGSNFQKADLKNIDLSYSNLCGCDFRNARLNGANLSDSKLNGADLRGAKIEKIILCNAKMYNCKIDIMQMRGLGIKEIVKYEIEVYEMNKKLTMEEIEVKYKELNPVSYAIWKKEPLS